MNSNINIKRYFRKEMMGVADYGTKQGRRGRDGQLYVMGRGKMRSSLNSKDIFLLKGFEISRKIDSRREDVSDLVHRITQ